MLEIRDIPKESLTPKERSLLYNQGEAVDHIPYSLIGTETAAVLYDIDLPIVISITQGFTSIPKAKS